MDECSNICSSRNPWTKNPRLSHPSSARPRNSWENDAMWEDPIVSDVRRTREELAARFDFDVKAIFADVRARQAALGGRLVSRRKRTDSADAIDRGAQPPLPDVSADATRSSTS